jgi:murein DD-endopeptidase MepM/ murein hydrolase activator NlpD
MGIGIYALLTPSAFHLNTAPPAPLLGLENALTLAAVQSSTFQPSFPVMETLPSHLSGHLSGHISDSTPRVGIFPLGKPQTAQTETGATEITEIKETTKITAVSEHPRLLTLSAPSASPAQKIDPLPSATLNGKTHSGKAVDGVIKETLLAYAPPTKKPHKSLNQTVTVGDGDTLSSILINAGVHPLEAQGAIIAIQAIYKPRNLRAGQQITLTFGPQKNGKSNGSTNGHANETNGTNGNDAHESAFQGLNLLASMDRKVGVSRNGNGGFSSHEVRRELKKKMVRAEGAIHISLGQATAAQGVPRDVVAEMVGAFSYDVDFQRDIRNNDAFEVMFEGLYDDENQFVRGGSIVFATLTLSGVRMPVYRYTNSNGMIEFYNEKGESVQKALLRTPVNGARLSSGYGKRRHPILGYNKMHKGVDFAAKKGTTIRAAGDGVISKAGRNGAYGHYVSIRHNSEYSTAYAHLSKYKKGVRVGKRVKQGAVIGYVGSTGRSTGSHLHFEVVRDGKRINPLSVKLPSGTKLAGKELKTFMALVDNIKRQYAQLPTATKLTAAREVQG